MDPYSGGENTILSAMSTSLPGSSGRNSTLSISPAGRRSSLFGPRGSVYDTSMNSGPHKRRASAWLMEQLTQSLEQNMKRRRLSSRDSDLIPDLSTHESAKARTMAQQLDWTPMPMSTGSYSTVAGARRRSRRLSGSRISLLDSFSWDNLLGSADYMTSGETVDGAVPRRFSMRVAAKEFGITNAEPIEHGKGADATTHAAAAAAVATKPKAKPKAKATSKKGRSKLPKETKLKKRASNRTFEARRRNRVAAALKQLKGLCMTREQQKKATKITILEAAVAALRRKQGKSEMNFEAAYDREESGKAAGMSRAAAASGAVDTKRSIRERRRRLQTNLLEAELAKLVLPDKTAEERAAASKCIILDKVCVTLGGKPLK